MDFKNQLAVIWHRTIKQFTYTYNLKPNMEYPTKWEEDYKNRQMQTPKEGASLENDNRNA